VRKLQKQKQSGKYITKHNNNDALELLRGVEYSLARNGTNIPVSIELEIVSQEKEQ